MINSLYDIPDSWKWVTLNDIGVIVSGGTPSTKEPEFWNGDIPWITPADLSGYEEVYISKGARNISLVGLDYSSAYLLPENSIVFSSRAPIGYVAITKNRLATNQGFKNVILSGDLVNPKYVYYYLKTIKEFAEKMASGTTFLELSTSKFKEIPIPISTPSEQDALVEKIEELFSYASDSIKNVDIAIAKSVLYLKKNIYQIFKGNLLQGGNVLGNLPNNWRWVKLKNIGEIYNGGTPKTNVQEYWDGEIPWITPSDLSNYEEKYISSGQKNISSLALENSSAKKLPKETVLFSSRAPIGYVVIAKNELTTNQGFKAIVLNEGIDSSYVYYFLKSIKDYANSIASGTTFLELSTEKFREIPIPLPPLNEQIQMVVEIEEVMNNTNSLIKELNVQKKNIQNSKEKILKEAFEGKLTERIDSDVLIEEYLQNIKKNIANFSLKQVEELKSRSKSKKANHNLQDIISAKFDNSSFRFEDLVELNIFSVSQLSEEWKKLIDDGFIKKNYNAETKSIQFKKS